MPLRVALDARWLHHRLHGIARYTLALIEHLPPNIQLDIVYNRQDFAPVQRPGALWIDAQTPLFARDEAWRMGRLLKRLRPQLLHIPSYWKPYASPCPWVMTVHDLIHLQPPVAPVHQLYYAWLQQHLHRAAGVLTVSQASADSLHTWAGNLPLTVTPLGTAAHYRPIGPDDVSLRQQHWQLSGPYALFVGNAKPHKQLALALQACALAGEKLVTVGVPTSGQPHHQALSDVPEALMPVLYRGARALLTPSLEEGFGLPGLEALACGTPVLASDLPVFHEVLGEGALYLPFHDPASWATALENLRSDPALRQRLTHSGLQRAAAFSWERLGQQTAEVYSACARP